jgi:glycosidase
MRGTFDHESADGKVANLRVSVVALASACLILAWPVARAASPAAAPGWADQVLYFAIVDRFADGDSGNNVNVDRTARGAFRDWPDNRSDMPWGDRPIRPGAGLPRDEALRADYRRLIGIRRAHPSLWRGRRESTRAEGDLVVFGRHDEASGDRVIVAVNRGDATAALDVPLPGAWAGGRVQDAWRATPVVVRDGVLTATVPGRQAAIFVSRGGQP